MPTIEDLSRQVSTLAAEVILLRKEVRGKSAPESLSFTQARKYAACSQKALQDALHSGELHAIKDNSSLQARWRIEREALDAWIISRHSGATNA